MRYGDDFIVIENDLEKLKSSKEKITEFVNNKLRLEINPKNEIIIKARQGLKFLGVEIFYSGRRLNKRNWSRVRTKLNLNNFSSYSGLVRQHSNEKKIKRFNWEILEKIIF